MKIQEQDIYHGAALTQIVEHPSFKALNKVDEKYGHYLINLDKRIFVKYRTNEKSPWTFTLLPQEIEAIKTDINIGANVFLCLICARETVCAIDIKEVRILVDLDSDKPQWIKVDSVAKGSMWLSGSKGKLTYSIRHNLFPNGLFQEKAESAI